MVTEVILEEKNQNIVFQGPNMQHGLTCKCYKWFILQEGKVNMAFIYDLYL